MHQLVDCRILPTSKTNVLIQNHALLHCSKLNSKELSFKLKKRLVSAKALQKLPSIREEIYCHTQYHKMHKEILTFVATQVVGLKQLQQCAVRLNITNTKAVSEIPNLYCVG